MRSSDLSPSAQADLLDDAKDAGRPVENWRQAFPEIVGRSAGMLKVLETVGKVARSDSSVLILGESGTGKELIAAAIHRLSHRSHKQFVPLNCSAIPDNLLESDLFGHEKGAFTGADRKKIGKFQFAQGGTIFLDEIGDMPQTLQAKLLRVLQDKKCAPLGGNELMEVDVRIIAATNMNLDQAVKKSSFRLDLYYRLNVLPIHIPPLRERTEDIPDLLEHFVETANRVQSVTSPCFLTDDVVRALVSFRWPGNIRQLQNVVERLVVMKGGGAIGVNDLPRELLDQIDESRVEPAPFDEPSAKARMPSPLPHKTTMPLGRPGDKAPIFPQSFGALPSDGMDLQGFIEGLENDLIRQALERTGNNRNQAAKLLGLNRTTLVERIKKRRLTTLNDPPKEL
jgi:transcriptional regulator with PAS, ATPase and Fis domain